VGSFSSLVGFLLVAIVVTLTPGPATAMVIRVAARDGRQAALGTVVGNSIGVLMWGVLSAVGVSSLILASDVAYDVLRIAGAAVLIWLGARTWWLTRRSTGAGAAVTGPDADRPVPGSRWVRRRAHWSAGLVTSVSNPKLAVFFVALFPQFLRPGEAVLPAALAMATLIVLLDLLWFSVLSTAVERATIVLRPRVRRVLERVTGSVMVAVGLRLAAEVR
jgi:threonine/homoserine/homoserine lactone efflux protein